MILALDTETTGVDFAHGSRPFVVTTCDGDGNLRWWEWDVNPMTRVPKVPAGDLDDLLDLIKSADELVLQNAKFDVKALGSLDQRFIDEWPWRLTFDTTLEAHLLDSKAPKSLDALGIRYARTDMTPKEEALGDAVKTARRIAKSIRKKWAVSKKGRPDMPSAKEKQVWKGDYWLPAALYASVERLQLEDEAWVLEEHPEFATALMDYAKHDPEVTLAVHLAMMAEIRDRKLEGWLDDRRKQLPVFARMEYKGVTVSRKNLRELSTRYSEESWTGRDKCVAIAKSRGYDLQLPVNGVNKSLREFVYDVLKLPVVISPKTHAPALDKNALDQYLKDLSADDPKAQFIKELQSIRQRDTAVSYMKGYERFRVEFPNDPNWWTLYPSINMTGTDTLRGSSSNPNEQNISKKENFNLRYCFGPAPGREWWSMDAKNLELRLPAYEAKEQMLIDLFEKPDDPPFYGSNHLVNFSAVYPDLWEGNLGKRCDDPKCCDGKVLDLKNIGKHVKKAYASNYYQWCKNGWFAIQYGAVMKDDGWGTADRAFHKQGAHALLFSRLNRLGDLNKHWIRFAKEHGYVETMIDKSVDPTKGYPLVVTRNRWGGVLETVPLSYHIQGTAMQWTNKGMYRCDQLLEAWRRNGFDAWLVMQVHDELVFDMPKRADPRVSPSKSNLHRARALARQMEKGGDDIGVPTPVSMEWHPESYSTGVSV